MYWYNYKTNFENLVQEVKNLKAARDEVRRKVDADTEEIKQNVKDWQKKVNNIIDDAEMLIKKNAHNFNSNIADLEEQAPLLSVAINQEEPGEEANNRCFMRFCPNLMNYYKHDREASRMVEEVTELLSEKERFNEVSNPKRLPDVMLASDECYDDFETRRSNLDKVLNALNDAKVDMLGVFGMGGVGKTTLVKEVGREAEKDMLFDEVMFAEFNQAPDIKKIQNEIAYKLGLEFTGESESERRNKLYARLKKDKEKDQKKDGANVTKKKNLLILDNIWEEVKLKEIGIPSGADLGESKLLLTARDQSVLATGCRALHNIDKLSDGEAWRLLKKPAGDFDENSQLKSLPQDVCKKCGGLPVAIVTVAKALKERTDPSIWRDAIRQFEKHSPENFKGDLREPYLSIELSYNFLRGEKLKKTFLLCSLMEQKASVLGLAKYAMCLNIFDGTNTMQQMRDKIYSFIQKLKDTCLLLDGDTKESFSMHDFIRQVAISIATRDDHVFCVGNENEWDWPGKTCTKIFLRDSKISEIPEPLECPELVSFALHNRGMRSDVKIPDEFFIKMTKLKVLHLTGMQISSLRLLPDHLKKNLQTLCLDHCDFGDVETHLFSSCLEK